MILSDVDMRESASLPLSSPHSLRISPAPYGRDIQPASIDLKLGHGFKRWNWDTRAQVFDRQVNNADDFMCDIPAEDLLEDGSYILGPGAMVLATTEETVTLGSALAAKAEGKSGWGRLGLIVEMAGFIDPGFSGQVTLELVNHSPMWLVLRPGMSIAQLIVFRLSSPAERPYGTPGLGSSYQHQRGPQAARRKVADYEGEH